MILVDIPVLKELSHSNIYITVAYIAQKAESRNLPLTWIKNEEFLFVYKKNSYLDEGLQC